MWINSSILDEISKTIFFANTPEFILEKLLDLNLFQKVKIFHSNNLEIENEILKYKEDSLKDKLSFSYYYFLILYYTFLFNKEFDKDVIIYDQFPFLKEVLQILKNKISTNVIQLNIEQKKPKLIIR